MLLSSRDGKTVNLENFTSMSDRVLRPRNSTPKPNWIRSNTVTAFKRLRKPFLKKKAAEIVTKITEASVENNNSSVSNFLKPLNDSPLLTNSLSPIGTVTTTVTANSRPLFTLSVSEQSTINTLISDWSKSPATTNFLANRTTPEVILDERYRRNRARPKVTLTDKINENKQKSPSEVTKLYEQHLEEIRRENDLNLENQVNNLKLANKKNTSSILSDVSSNFDLQSLLSEARGVTNEKPKHVQFTTPDNPKPIVVNPKGADQDNFFGLENFNQNPFLESKNLNKNLSQNKEATRNDNFSENIPIPTQQNLLNPSEQKKNPQENVQDWVHQTKDLQELYKHWRQNPKYDGKSLATPRENKTHIEKKKSEEPFFHISDSFDTFPDENRQELSFDEPDIQLDSLAETAMEANLEKAILNSMKTIPRAENDRASFLRFLTAAEAAYRSLQHRLNNRINQNKFVAHLRTKLIGSLADSVSSLDLMTYNEFKTELIRSTNLIRKHHIIDNAARTAKQTATETPLGFFNRLENLRKEYIFALQIQNYNQQDFDTMIRLFDAAVLRNAPRQLEDKPLRLIARHNEFQSFEQFKRFLQQEREDDDEYDVEPINNGRQTYFTDQVVTDTTPTIRQFLEKNHSQSENPSSTFVASNESTSEIAQLKNVIEKLAEKLDNLKTSNDPQPSTANNNKNFENPPERPSRAQYPQNFMQPFSNNFAGFLPYHQQDYQYNRDFGYNNYNRPNRGWRNNYQSGNSRQNRQYDDGQSNERNQYNQPRNYRENSQLPDYNKISENNDRKN